MRCVAVLLALALDVLRTVLFYGVMQNLQLPMSSSQSVQIGFLQPSHQHPVGKPRKEHGNVG